MPDKRWDEMLPAAAAEVLETMFFCEVHGPARAATPAEGRLAARLAFEGTPSGALWVSVSAPAASMLAVNFLAPETDEPLPRPQLDAVIGELANMICGSLLSRAACERRFKLAAPEPLPDGASLPSGAPTQSLDLGEGTIDLT